MDKLIRYENLDKKIISLRRTEVILDRDLATLYEVETRTLKQAVKRNIDRFPQEFMFELSNEEIDLMVSQSVIPSKKYFGGAKPYAFTEQGVAMLSAVLKSPLAIQVSIQIIRAFVQIRHLTITNVEVLQKIDQIEKRHIHFECLTNTRFDNVFKEIEKNNLPPSQGIFYEGQIFDAYTFVSNIIRLAKESIILIDNYVDETVLTLLSKRKNGVRSIIFTQKISKQLLLDINKHNAQYESIEVKTFTKAHDRFLIIDESVVYHIGASLKDLGRKWFAFSKIDLDASELIARLK